MVSKEELKDILHKEEVKEIWDSIPKDSENIRRAETDKKFWKEQLHPYYDEMFAHTPAKAISEVVKKEVEEYIRVINIIQDQRLKIDLRPPKSENQLTDIEKEDCIKATETVDGLWVGVDFIPARNREKEQPFIIEVNSSPGSGQIDDVNETSILE